MVWQREAGGSRPPSTTRHGTAARSSATLLGAALDRSLAPSIDWGGHSWKANYLDPGLVQDPNVPGVGVGAGLAPVRRRRSGGGEKEQAARSRKQQQEEEEEGSDPEEERPPRSAAAAAAAGRRSARCTALRPRCRHFFRRRALPEGGEGEEEGQGRGEGQGGGLPLPRGIFWADDGVVFSPASPSSWSFSHGGNPNPTFSLQCHRGYCQICSRPRRECTFFLSAMTALYVSVALKGRAYRGRRKESVTAAAPKDRRSKTASFVRDGRRALRRCGATHLRVCAVRLSVRGRPCGAVRGTMRLPWHAVLRSTGRPLGCALGPHVASKAHAALFRCHSAPCGAM
jgi:hypothetical protein